MNAYLERCKFFFIHAGIFSFFINLLLMTLPLYMLQVFDRVLSSRSRETLLLLTLIAIGALLVWTFLEMLRARLLVRAGMAIDHLLADKVLTNMLLRLDPAGAQPPTATLRDLNTLRNYLMGQNVVALFDLPWAPLFLLVIFLFHPWFGILAAGGMLVMFGLTLADEKLTKKLLLQAGEWTQSGGRFIEPVVQHAELVKALGMVPAIVRKWRTFSEAGNAYYALASNRSSVILAATRFVRLSLQIGMLGTGAWLVITQNVTPGIMIAATLILARAMAPVERALSGWKGFIEARAAYGRLNRLVQELDADQRPRLSLPPPRGRLTVEAVTFGTPQGGLILKRITFGLEEGELLGIAGPSAAGKSTLARVVLGIYQPLSGSVRLDGVKLSDWDHTELGGYLGYLPQEVRLFEGTVAENIARFADPGGHSEAVIRAAQRARVHDLILNLPEGYDTRIGPGGVVLSGGQRQRIALARALFGDPRLVVLDEPNANLDSDGEAALLQVLRQLRSDGVTTLLVTHKPSILAATDKVMVLRDGQIARFGPAREVLGQIVSRPQPAAKLQAG
ncbi:MAG TPA: type I secretion system permease/ATPase [Methylothermaceae bacterium]|nr:type I secretion system permease/ATPase [Methylothermaceae bacterium]